MTKTKAKEKTKISKMKTTTIIKDTTGATTGMGVIREKLTCLIHQVEIFKVGIQASG